MAHDSHPDRERSMLSRLSRRQMIALSSGAMVGLAGCAGQESESVGTTTSPDDTTTASGDEDTSEDGQESGGTPVTTELSSHFPAWEPSNTNFNPYSPAGEEPPFSANFWWENTLYVNHAGEICHFTIDEVEFKSGGCEVLYHFKEDFHWWDGTPLTAEDWLVTRKINQYQSHGSPENAPVDVSLVDDYTLKEVRTTPVNPTAKKQGLNSTVNTRRDYFRSWLEKYEDASSESAVEDVTSELSKHKIDIDTFVDEGLGSGMWKLKDWNPTRVTYEKFDGHPRSDWTNLETWKWELVSDDQKFDQAFLDNRFDMGELNFNLVPKNDKIENIAEISITGVPKITFNFRNKHLARRGVRRAIAYLLDYKQIRAVLKENYGTPYAEHPYRCGMSSSVAENWLGGDFLDDLISYGETAQTEKAEQAMQDAGYTKEGDVWVGPDGDAVEGLKYITPPWSIYQSIEQYVSPILNEFGIKNKALQPSRSNFYKRLGETYEFDLLNWFFYGNHPTTTYATGVSTIQPYGLDGYESVVEQTEESSSSGCEVDRSTPGLKQELSPKLHHPIRATFPSEVGAMEVGGSGQTLYPIKWNKIMSQTQDRAEIEELSRKIAWYYNWQIPHIGLYEETWNYWGNVEKYTFRDNHPETDRTAREHTIANEDAFQMKGHVSAKTE